MISSVGNYMLDVKILKNSEVIDQSITSEVIVMDTDFLQFHIESDPNQNIKVYIEDYLLPISYISELKLFCSVSDKIFRESFGHSNLRIFCNDEMVFEKIFNVCTNESKFDQIKSMVKYLLDNNERILDMFFKNKI